MSATTPDALTFDLAQVPFSRRGSFFAISRLDESSEGPAGLYLRTLHGDAKHRALFRLEVLHQGAVVDFTDHATAEVLVLDVGALGKVEVNLTDSAFIASGNGVALRLWPLLASPYDVILNVADGHWQYTNFGANLNLMLTTPSGSLEAEPGWNGLRAEHAHLTVLPEPTQVQTDAHGDRVNPPPVSNASYFELRADEFQSSFVPNAPTQSAAGVRAETVADFASWPQRTAPTPPRYAASRDLAAYVNWSSVVGPTRNLKRATMYMSKNWMTKTWSWDHCFNAMALTQLPTLAIDQFLTIFDHQDTYGALPDCVDDATTSFNFAKPPIHGWAWRWMIRRMIVDHADTVDVYRRLSRLTNWWLQHRVTDGGLPHYRHGNDSGWDNGTAFRRVVPIESPDLCAFLVIQMDVLAELAGALGHSEEQVDWATRADRLLTRMMTKLWVDGRFVAMSVIDQRPIPSDSLLMYVPIVLGRRLPHDVFASLADGLVTHGFLTSHGLATESPTSECYESDGYWRGPIWAPSTFLIHEGLLDGGRPDLAELIARRFCDTVDRSGMAENFDALTGEGLRDRAYTWTSSVFLMLAENVARLDAADSAT